MVMMLRQCCCCCSLNTGTIILGTLNAVFGLVYLIAGIAVAVTSHNVNLNNKDGLIGDAAAKVVVGGIVLLVAICLIIGADKGKPGLLVPWMVCNAAFLIATTVVYIYVSAVLFASREIASGVGGIAAAVIHILLVTYFLLVVYSLYRELKGQHHQTVSEEFG